MQAPTRRGSYRRLAFRDASDAVGMQSLPGWGPRLNEISDGPSLAVLSFWSDFFGGGPEISVPGATHPYRCQ